MPLRAAPVAETRRASRSPYILPSWKMWPRPSHWLPHCRNIVTWSSAKPQPKGGLSKPASRCAPATWSVPVATMLWIGLTRPKAPFCGPFMSKGSAHEITLPWRTSPAARLMTSGVMKFTVPSSSSGPQRPQFRNFLQYSSSNAGVTAGRLGMMILRWRILSVRREAAVEQQRLPGDVRRLRTHEIRDRARHLEGGRPCRGCARTVDQHVELAEGGEDLRHRA